MRIVVICVTPRYAARPGCDCSPKAISQGVNRNLMSKLAPLGIAAGLALSLTAQATPTVEELAEIVAAQQEQIDALQRNPSASRTHIGGYGELHVNFVKDADNAVDFHRFVLFFGHDFNSSLRFRSEFELEHSLAGDGAPGEVELEQAYIEYDLAPGRVVRGGLMLVPVGILNETHEPPTFYGVERNRVEARILPATWWEAGMAYAGTLAEAGLSYDLMVHSGLAVDPDSISIRSGRQKVAEATANDWAGTARIRYHGVPGLQLAASLQYQLDLSQAADDGVDDALLFTTHAIYNRGIFGVRALFAQWDINGDKAAETQRDRIGGWYIEPSVRPDPRWGLFVRYEALEQKRDAEETNTVAGVNFWLHEHVVIKADYTVRENPDDPEVKSVNLGLGYQF